jgi:predicted RNA polymerase sigma factor
VLRRETVLREKERLIAAEIESRLGKADDPLTRDFQDEQLTLMFTCCHPAFTRETQTALILKTLCGFTIGEIARAYLAQETAIAQRIVRSRKKIREQNIEFELPSGSDLTERIETVLEVIYLMFNEGYSASEGDLLIRRDLCEEAVRLCNLLVRSDAGNVPEAHALLALMLFQASRFETRLDTDGNLLPLAEQDRAQWDKALIDRGMRHLEMSASGKNLSEYHLQAAIASAHAVARSHEQTDWAFILHQYDNLIDLNPSPVWKLNRAVAIAEVQGPEAALVELDRLSVFSALRGYFLYHATRGEMLVRLNRPHEAQVSYRIALDLAGTQPEQTFLRRKLENLGLHG